MNPSLDISSVDDKIEWEVTSTLTMVVRKPDADRALTIQCFPIGKQWTVIKAILTSGDFAALRGAVADQELVATFDDLQEALAAGAAVARKWLADPARDDG